MPCSAYFNQNPFSADMNIKYSWDFQINTGLNRFIFATQKEVTKGQFIVLNQITGKVALDNTGYAVYSDLAWDSIAWARLNSTINYRFYVNALNKYQKYWNKFTVSHTYSSSELFNLTVKGSNSVQVFQQIVSISECKFRY